MRPSEIDFNFEEMIPVRMPVTSRNPGMTLSITEKGIINMNSVLCKNIKSMNPSMEMLFLHSPDYRKIALVNQSSEENTFIFHKDGRIHHEEFMQKLCEKGYRIPAKYVVEWSPEDNAWLGILEEVPGLTDSSTIVRKAAARVNTTKGRKKNVKI